MATHSESTKKARLYALLKQRGIQVIDPPLMTELRATLAPISEPYLENLLRESGIPLHPFVEGVRLHSPEDMRRTLLALAELYESSANPRSVRERVISAKVRLRALLSRTSDPEVRLRRQDMHLELMTWLENPTVFPLWLRLRQQASETMKSHDSRH
ncbi:MAG: hypothetical protein SGI92_27565 [Bryobacteraceae bacterium]|nr:hypothetical protein [Bryobacteraceae bacterium]